MKKNWIFIVLILVIIVGGVIIFLTARKGGGAAPIAKQKFMWGVTANPDSARKYNSKMWKQEVAFINQLGVDWVRVGYDNSVSNRESKYNSIVDVAEAAKVNVILQIDSTQPIAKITDAYSDGQKVGTEVATMFKGRVHYYQILNELGGTALKGGNMSGENFSDFDPTTAKKLEDWVKGATDAVKKIDPSAQTIITFHWTHYALLDKMVSDGVKFDVLGWDWYSDMGLMQDKKIADGTLLVDKLKSYNKPIVLAEVNYQPKGKTPNSESDLAEQVKFIQSMADWAKTVGQIKGFFVQELVDAAPFGSQKASYFGLVKVKQVPDSSNFEFGDLKPAFNTYKEIISKNN